MQSACKSVPFFFFSEKVCKIHRNAAHNLCWLNNFARTLVVNKTQFFTVDH